MRRVVVTGLGIVSAIGNDAATVTESLKAGKSGIVFSPEYAERGFRSQVEGRPNIDITEHVDKRQLRFMGPGSAYAYIAMQQAIFIWSFTSIQIMLMPISIVVFVNLNCKPTMMH